MATTIKLQPISRIEGHARVVVELNDAGDVDDAKFHVVALRGVTGVGVQHQYVDARAAVEHVVACTTQDQIAAGSTQQHVFARTANQNVGANQVVAARHGQADNLLWLFLSNK